MLFVAGTVQWTSSWLAPEVSQSGLLRLVAHSQVHQNCTRNCGLFGWRELDAGVPGFSACYSDLKNFGLREPRDPVCWIGDGSGRGISSCVCVMPRVAATWQAPGPCPKGSLQMPSGQQVCRILGFNKILPLMIGTWDAKASKCSTMFEVSANATTQVLCQRVTR